MKSKQCKGIDKRDYMFMNRHSVVAMKESKYRSVDISSLCWSGIERNRYCTLCLNTEESIVFSAKEEVGEDEAPVHHNLSQ